MDEDDFRALIAILEEELAATDLSNIADPSHYLYRSAEDTDMRLLPPQKRAIEMLAAFGRVASINDRATYDIAMLRLQRVCRNDGPQAASFVAVSEDDREIEVSLADAPDLSAIRQDLDVIIGRLREAGSLPPESI